MHKEGTKKGKAVKQMPAMKDMKDKLLTNQKEAVRCPLVYASMSPVLLLSTRHLFMPCSLALMVCMIAMVRAQHILMIRSNWKSCSVSRPGDF